MIHGLGRVVEHDERSRQYAFTAMAGPEVDTFWPDTAHPVPSTPSGLLATVGYSIVMIGVP